MSNDSNNLNILRASAVLMVFVSHAMPNNSGYSLGLAGVLIFFVHTSLVLMLSLERSGDSWLQFMLRRVFRVYPLAIAATLIYLAIGFGRLSIPAMLANITLTQNVFYTQSVPGVLWSLPYEIQMYALLPLAFIVARRTKEPISAWVVCMMAVAGAVLILPVEAVRVVRFVPCFLAGVMSYRLSLSKKPAIHFAWLFPAILGCVALYCSVRIELLPGWLMCFLLGLTLPVLREVPNGVATRCAAFIAKYSFGIYLFHTIFLKFIGTGVRSVVALALTISASVIAYHMIERPLTEYGRHLANRRRATELGCYAGI